MGLIKRLVDWWKGANPTVDPIKHVVVLMFENHSFDQMLGCFKSVYPKLDGVDLTDLRSNQDSTGRIYLQRSSNDTVVTPDPRHETDHVLNQLKDNGSGFVSEYEKTHPETTTGDRQKIIDYFGVGDLPVLHELAQHFLICDHWHSSVPGPTWTNRFFVHSGTSKGIVAMPEHISETNLYLHYDQDTIFDWLNDAGRSWRVYFGDVPQSLVLRHQWKPRNALHYHFMHKFYDDASGGTLADYSFIEPNYMKGDQNDDHPPHSTMRAQRLLGQVYNALRFNERTWNSTLLVVLYDEHGGFYDHVPPPKATVPDEYNAEYTFDQYGVRVPALLISPWVKNDVLDTVFDHTSLLRYLTDKWGLGNLTERVRKAHSFADAIQKSPRDGTPKTVQIPALAIRVAAGLPVGAAPDTTPEEIAEPKNDFQRSLIVFTEHLEQNETAPAARTVVKMTAGPLSEEQQAKLRVEAFLDQQKAKARLPGP